MKIIEIKENQLYLVIIKRTRGVQDYNIKIKQQQPIFFKGDIRQHLQLIKAWYELYSSETDYKDVLNGLDLDDIEFSVTTFLEKNKQGELVNKYIANLKFTLDIRKRNNE